MTARKRIISVISIITLVLAITAGITLSAVVGAGNNKYVGENITLSNTDVTVDVQTSTKSQAEENIIGTPIATAEELQAFIRGTDTYGYLTSDDIVLDWEGVGSQSIFTAGRVLDGNGHTLTLKEADAGKNAGYAESFRDPLERRDETIANLAKKRNYGMLVDYNLGTIKNIKFVYNSTSAEVTNNDQDGNSGEKTLYANYVGLVCGTNTGRIENCDLNVSGSFTYKFNIGKINDTSDGKNSRFETYWGGIAGRNGGIITNITAHYDDFTLNMQTTAGNRSKTGFFGTTWEDVVTDAKSIGGGIAGRNDAVTDADITKTEISNIIIMGSMYPKMNSTPQDKGLTKGKRYGEFAAVVSTNSQYSHGIGASADAQAKVDNIITAFNVDYANASQTMGDAVSMNAVVFCGKATNVTMLATTDKPVTINGVKQHVDYQTDHCNCGVAGNPGEHEAGYGNVIHTGEYSNVTVGFDNDGKQTITVTPKDKANSILGELAFTKYTGRGTTEDDAVLEAGIEDSASYADVASNASTYLYNKTDIRQDSFTFKVRPYQATSSKFWEIGAYSYLIANISNVGAAEYTYTGEDYLKSQFSYTTLVGGKTGAVDPEGLNARSTADGGRVTEGRLPGEYNIKLEEKEAGLSYVDKANQVVAFVEETPTTHTFKINLATIIPLDASLLAENWMDSQHDFTFELAGGIEGAADGYEYEVNGSQPTPVSGLVMQNKVDTKADGRTYIVRLTSGGVAVTEDYTYTVKIDLTNPTAEIIHYEHPADRYYTHNKITVKAVDNASGVASIVMNSYDGDNLNHTHDIMSEGTLNDDGTYTWQFQDTGRKEIVVTDNVGHSSTIEVNVKIDTTQPTITVDAYYYVEKKVENGMDGDGNPTYEMQQVKTPYVSGTEITSAVYFEANATFGESGGGIRYSLDNGTTWQDYNGTLTVKRPAQVKFRAVSNTYTHPDDDVHPYPNRYPLTDNWGDKTVDVVIQLEQVVITLDDLDIEGAVKTFDGTDVFNGSVSIRDGFISAHNINGEVQITSVKYADVNSGEVALIIEVFCTDDTKLLVNEIEGASGVIEKKAINITVDDKTKIYGVGLPVLTYTQEGMIEGFEESLSLYVQKPDGYTGSYELLPQTADGAGYVIAVAEDTQFNNYVLQGVVEGRLRVTLAPIDRLVYERGQFTGLDLSNIAERNLEVGFIRSNGNYERLDVTFYAYEAQFDNATGEVIGGGYTRKVDDITKVGAGFYKVVLSLPEYDAAGELLTNKYVMDASLSEFMIKIIDSTIFDKDEETENVDEAQPVEGEYTAPDMYENGSTDTDNTDMTVEPSHTSAKDYVAMISIFCAVAMAMAFAFGIARAIVRRVKSK